MARVNRRIALLEQDQPTFGERTPGLGYVAGIAAAGARFDYLIVEFEHQPFDLIGLRAFMRGLVDRIGACGRDGRTRCRLRSA